MSEIIVGLQGIKLRRSDGGRLPRRPLRLGRASLSLLPLSLCLPIAAAQAEPTRIVVRAQSHDAKFIGTSMGGVEVVLKDAGSGKVLARGLTKGGTGDTKRLVTEPRVRGAALANEGSAAFETTLDIETPTLIQVEGRGPRGSKGAAVAVASSLWVLPGRHVAGDGLILTFPGLVVEPAAVRSGAGLEISAKVTLMCGCPLEAGGTWDAANYAVTAHVRDGSREIARVPLAFAGETSLYAATLPAVPRGRYTLLVTAADRTTLNTGVGEMRVPVQ